MTSSPVFCYLQTHQVFACHAHFLRRLLENMCYQNERVNHKRKSRKQGVSVSLGYNAVTKNTKFSVVYNISLFLLTHHVHPIVLLLVTFVMGPRLMEHPLSGTFWEERDVRSVLSFHLRVTHVLGQSKSHGHFCVLYGRDVKCFHRVGYHKA